MDIALTTVFSNTTPTLITGINSLYNNTTSLIVGKMNYLTIKYLEVTLKHV